MAFPSRDFFQEYSTDEEVREFAEKKNFPGVLMKLGKVRGEGSPDVWKFFKTQTGASYPIWNFQGKFLVSKTGSVSVPTDLEKDIEALMEEK